MNRGPCLSADTIADLVRGNATEDDELHLLACRACTRRVSLILRVESAGIEPIADVVAEVDVLIEKLMEAPRRTWWRIVREADFTRQDVALRLLSLATDARLRDPDMAIAFANAATTIIERLPIHTDGLADLRFEGWKITASLLRETGRYVETDIALEKAEEASHATSTPKSALAAVLLSRALLSAEPDVWKPDDASNLLDRVEDLRDERDGRLANAICHARALLLSRSGDLSGAREEFAALLSATSPEDRESYLNALNNLTWVRVELREADAEVEEAVRFLLDENLTLGRTQLVARARWMMGRLNATRGNYRRAEEMLAAAMAAMTDVDTSIRIGLDRIEALLLDDCPTPALHLARELASAAVDLDQREPSRRRGLTAQVLAYLREAAQRQAWTADLVSDLARYIDQITRQRPFDFVPPMPLADM